MSFFEKLKAVPEEEQTPLEEEELTEKEPSTKLKVKEKKTRKKKEETIEPKEIVKPKRAGWFDSEGQLTVDVYQTEREIVIQSAIAGISCDDLDIDIDKDVVTIRGFREAPKEEEERNYFYQECYWGPFSREIILPADIDSLHSEACFKDGILTIRLPKIEKEKKKKLSVKET